MSRRDDYEALRADSPVNTAHCDVHGNGILRVLKHTVARKCIPMGNYGGGGGFRCILMLVLLHYSGDFLFHLVVRFQRQIDGIHRLRQRLRQTGK